MSDLVWILMIALLGVPALVRTWQAFWARARSTLAAQPTKPWPAGVTVFALGLLLLLDVPYLMVLLGEAFVAATCAGAGCAQGGVGLLMFTPVPWLVLGAVKGLNRWLDKRTGRPLIRSPRPVTAEDVRALDDE